MVKLTGILAWHERNIHTGRIRLLTDVVAQLADTALPPTILDIGCGDGRLAKAVAERLGALEVVGVDVQARPEALVSVQQYDGLKLPFDDHRFDVVLLCDVLHHAGEPGVVLREALRVLRPRGRLIVKDHFRFGLWSQIVLLAMDFIGNAPRGVLVRGKYISSPEWIKLVATSGGAYIEQLVWPLKLHDLPWRLIARSDYQFAMSIRHRTG